MGIIWLFFAGFFASGVMLGYGLCLHRHRYAISEWQTIKHISCDCKSYKFLTGEEQ